MSMWIMKLYNARTAVSFRGGALNRIQFKFHPFYQLTLFIHLLTEALYRPLQTAVQNRKPVLKLRRNARQRRSPIFFQWGDLVRELWCRLILCHCTSNTLKGCGFNLPVTISCHLLRYKIVSKSQILRLNTLNSISAAAPSQTTPQIF